MCSLVKLNRREYMLRSEMACKGMWQEEGMSRPVPRHARRTNQTRVRPSIWALPHFDLYSSTCASLHPARILSPAGHLVHYSEDA